METNMTSNNFIECTGRQSFFYLKKKKRVLCLALGSIFVNGRAYCIW